MVDMEQRPNVFPGAPGSREPRSGMKGIIVLLIILLLVIVGAGVWYFYSAKVAQAPETTAVKPVPLPGELDFYTFTPITQNGRSPLSGVLRYSASTTSSIFPLTPSTFIIGVSLSPLRDYVLLSTVSSTTANTGILSSYSLQTHASTVVLQEKGVFLDPFISGDGNTLLYTFVDSETSTNQTMTTYNISSKKTSQYGVGVPIGLSYDGKSFIYDAPDTRLHIQNTSASTSTSTIVSDVLQLATTAMPHPFISVAMSPDRQYLAIVGPTKTFTAKIDWVNTKLIDPAYINSSYSSGTFNQQNVLLLAKTNGTADSYLPTTTGFVQGASYIIPPMTSQAELLGWVTTK